MPNRSRNWFCLLAAGVTASLIVGTVAPASAAVPGIQLRLGQSDFSHAGYRRYHDDFDYSPRRYYIPPPPRTYRFAPPPATYYEPPIYGWVPPQRPAICGKYRYWNGEFCADARYRPPYVGPRW